MKPDFCKDFVWKQTAEGGLTVTPWRYDDGDKIVVYARRTPMGWRLDDNGEAALRLSMDGIDVDGERAQARIKACELSLGVRWDESDDALYLDATEVTFESGALAVAEAAAQLAGLGALRQDRAVSDFKARVLELVKAVAKEAQIEFRADVPVDESQTIVADAWLASARPLLVFAANSTQRLLEAEIAWLDAKRRSEPTFVLALVEDAKQIGLKNYTRANYYTDKTVEFASTLAVADLLKGQIALPRLSNH
ncbi:MAG: DUF1828 domain-containing protein [Burkholderiaceae bacterium]|nr:DUF1828 domain-containing protein [Burkholderiaceae bacterium]